MTPYWLHFTLPSAQRLLRQQGELTHEIIGKHRFARAVHCSGITFPSIAGSLETESKISHPANVEHKDGDIWRSDI
jgi:hypothetical protein